MASLVAPNAPVQVLKSIFAKYDKDNSGSINASELKDLCYDLGYCFINDEAFNAVKILDKDGSGTIDFNEFAGWWKDNDKFKKLDEAQSDRIKEAIVYFRYFDADKSGTISAEEYKQLHADLVKNNLIPASISAEQGLKQLDQSGDNKVSFNEFINYMDVVQHY